MVDEDFFARSEPSEHLDISLLSNTDKEKELTKRDETRHVKDLIQNTTVNRVFCVTERGYMGLVPNKSKKGDWVVVLFGGHTPFVLRERESHTLALGDRKRWEVVGECYIQEFMDGEALNGPDQAGIEV